MLELGGVAVIKSRACPVEFEMLGSSLNDSVRREQNVAERLGARRSRARQLARNVFQAR